MLLCHSRHTKIIESMDITEEITIIEAEEDVVLNVDEIGEVVVVNRVTVI